MSIVFEKEKLKINLSNTESIGSSIYNYSDLKKTKVSSVSSTSSYFLSTNSELSKKVLDYLNCANTSFWVDVSKTKEYINHIDNILKNYDKSDFHGELKDYYSYKKYYIENNDDFEIGFAKASIEEGHSGRSYLRFNNENEFVKIFRGIVIAIFTSLIVEKRNDKNYIYPVMKDELFEEMYKNIKDEFREYMLDVKKLNESSVEQYINVIDYTSLDAINDGILDKSIYYYSNANDVRVILEELRQDDHFNNITFKRNHINTAAIGNYIKFLEHKEILKKENGVEQYINVIGSNSLDTISDGALKKSIDDYSNVNEELKEMVKIENDFDSKLEPSAIEDEIASLILKLKIVNNNVEKSQVIKDIIRNCYEILNYYR